MGILDFIKVSKRGRADFGTESEAGVKIRLQNADLKRRKMELELQRAEMEAERDRLRLDFEMERMRQQIAELRGDFEEEEEESGGNIEDGLLAALLSKVLAGQQPAPAAPAAPAPIIEQPEAQITEQQIKEIWEAQDKKTQIYLKALNDEQIIAEIKKRYPALNKESENKILFFVHNERKTGLKGFLGLK